MDEFNANTDISSNMGDVETQSLRDAGMDELIYVRKIDGDILSEMVDEIPDDVPKGAMWAMFSASGEPMMIAEKRDDILSAALENELGLASLN